MGHRPQSAAKVPTEPVTQVRTQAWAGMRAQLMTRVRAQSVARLGFCEVRIRAQPGPRIVLVFLLCRRLSGAVRAGYRSSFQHSPALSPTLDFPSSGRRWGFLGLPPSPLLPLSF